MIPRLREAVGVGFEPTVAYATTVFKTAAFVHSAIPPSFSILLLLIIHYINGFVKKKSRFFSWVSKKDANSRKNEAFQDCVLYSIPLKTRNVKFIFKKLFS